MNKGHHLLNENSVIEYVLEMCDFFNSKNSLSAKEIGDGNINYVFRVTDKETGRSMIIKQADIYLRSSGRSFDVNHNRIEYNALIQESKMAPEYVPEIYFYDQDMCAIGMEDIGNYKNLRLELMSGQMFANLADNMVNFIIKAILPTCDVIISSKTKKDLVSEFVNFECCDISEDLVFTEPYNDYKKQNVYCETNTEFIQREIYNNTELKVAVSFLREAFMNHSQCLLHADLHTGSIFVNKDGIKVIDPEFSFYGPLAYDTGNIVANLYFAKKYHEVFNNKEMVNYLNNTIVDFFKKLSCQLRSVLKSKRNTDIYNDEFIDAYCDEIMHETMGYAGTEIIRRTIGDSKTKEINMLSSLKDYWKVERELVSKGISLIMSNKNESIENYFSI